jgi:hypothetical protein
MRLKDVSRDNLIDLYHNQRLSTRKIAEIYGASNTSIRKWIRALNIDVIDFLAEKYKAREQYFTKEMDEYIIGTLLGDGHIEIEKAYRKSGRLEICHSLKQQDYLLWQLNFVIGLTDTLRTGESTTNGKTYKSCGFHTLSHPKFLEYRNLFYGPDGIKVIKPSIKDRFTIKSLAVLIMDDGSHHRNDTMRIATDCFTLEDHRVLQNMLIDNFGLKANIGWEKEDKEANQKAHYYMWFNKTNAVKLSDLIRPHVIESMQYKLVAAGTQMKRVRKEFNVI